MPYSRNRHILAISGADRMEFLHGLVTNDVAPSPEALAYSALLTPQGKFIADFFLFQDCHTIYLDAASSDVAELKMRLGMYILRADVTINDSTLKVYCGTGREPFPSAPQFGPGPPYKAPALPPLPRPPPQAPGTRTAPGSPHTCLAYGDGGTRENVNDRPLEP